MIFLKPFRWWLITLHGPSAVSPTHTIRSSFTSSGCFILLLQMLLSTIGTTVSFSLSVEVSWTPVAPQPGMQRKWNSIHPAHHRRALPGQQSFRQHQEDMQVWTLIYPPDLLWIVYELCQWKGFSYQGVVGQYHLRIPWSFHEQEPCWPWSAS